MEIILGSQSPRRREIFSFFSLPFRQVSPDFDEVAQGNKHFLDVEETVVEFCQLSESEIHKYAETFSPLDKAGGYAIQKAGSLIVKRLQGCYYNVMGLPLQTVRRLLLKAGIDLWDHFKSI